jgi:hypothetical protein
MCLIFVLLDTIKIPNTNFMSLLPFHTEHIPISCCILFLFLLLRNNQQTRFIKYGLFLERKRALG